MDKFKLAAIGAVALALSYSMAASGQVDESKEGLGDVVYSILPPELFNQTHSGSWRVLDGSDLASSVQLSQYLETQGSLDLLPNPDGGLVNLPDARGVFVRGMNGLRDAETGDPDGATRAVGSYQDDAFEAHSHGFRSAWIGRHRSGRDRDNETQTILKGSVDRDNRNPNAAQRRNFNQAIADTGGVETRPRNVALYLYVKVGN